MSALRRMDAEEPVRRRPCCSPQEAVLHLRLDADGLPGVVARGPDLEDVQHSGDVQEERCIGEIASRADSAEGARAECGCDQPCADEHGRM